MIRPYYTILERRKSLFERDNPFHLHKVMFGWDKRPLPEITGDLHIRYSDLHFARVYMKYIHRSPHDDAIFYRKRMR